VNKCLTGTSQKTETRVASHSTSAITPLTTTKTSASENCSAAPVKKSSCEREPETLSLFGESSLTLLDSKELIALFSATKAQSSARTLSDRLTKSLMSAGLVRGITPMSTRRKCGAAIPDFVLYVPGGGRVEQLNPEDFLSSNGLSPSRHQAAP